MPAPHMVIHIEDKDYVAYVVIDSVVGEKSAGGVRIYSDLSLPEVRDLAREMSFKYALFRLPRGGAKAGVKLAAGLAPARRLAALEDFGSKLGPLIRAGIYNPGMDMNCGAEELRAIYRGAGITLGAITDTSWFTALSVYHSLDASVQEMGVSHRPVSLAIEGFGSVAFHLARRLAGDFRIVGVATLAGAVVNPEGFDAAELADLRSRHGDELVRKLSGKPIASEDFLTLEVDVLIPGARTRTITRELADRVRTRAVIPIANAPYEKGAVPALHSRGVVCLPGYMVNVGGVLASSLFDRGVSRASIEGLFASRYRDVVRQIIRSAGRRNMAVSEFSDLLASSCGAERAVVRRSSLARRVYERFVHRRLPRRVRALEARRHFEVSMRSLHSQAVRAERIE